MTQLHVSIAFRFTVFVDSMEYHGMHGMIVGFLQHGIRTEEDGTPFLL